MKGYLTRWLSILCDNPKIWPNVMVTTPRMILQVTIHEWDLWEKTHGDGHMTRMLPDSQSVSTLEYLSKTITWMTLQLNMIKGSKRMGQKNIEFDNVHMSSTDQEFGESTGLWSLESCPLLDQRGLTRPHQVMDNVSFKMVHFFFL